MACSLLALTQNTQIAKKDTKGCIILSSYIPHFKTIPHTILHNYTEIATGTLLLWIY